MFETEEYELLDAGHGRKLERFGREILDRPSPAAEGMTPTDPASWRRATVRFESERGGQGEWERRTSAGSDEGEWSVRHGAVRLGLQLRPSANIGIFPEQAENWNWITDRVERMVDGGIGHAPRVLNLFAYTGGATLAAAAAGAEVTHVDSSGPTVAWAKRNAAASSLDDRPIRWLVEDAVRFVAREVRRGNHYDGVIADPPTYGHGPKGRPFKFARHLDELLEGCGALLDEKLAGPGFLVFSCHAPGFGQREAERAVRAVVPAAGGVEAVPLDLRTTGGRRLAAGVCARWAR